MLAKAIQSDNKAVQDFIKQQFADTITNAMKAISEDDTYEMLVQGDQASGAVITEDPCLCVIKKRKIEEANKGKLPPRQVSAEGN